MKILSAQQIREADQFTILNEPISSLALMERASEAFIGWFLKKFTSEKRIAVVCGRGNNGGDGLAISRLLIENGYNATVFLVPEGSDSPDFLANIERLPNNANMQVIEPTNLDLGDYDVVIDGIFGSGLSRPARGSFAEVIEVINNAGSKVVAIDIPSGLFADQKSEGVVVKADYTVSFQLPKLAFMLQDNYDYVGEWYTLDIGLNMDFIQAQDTMYNCLGSEEAQALLKGRTKSSHKGNYGKVLLISGAYGKMGATILSGRACLRVGAGLLTVYAPSSGYEILQTALPEAMVISDPSENHITQVPSLEKFTTIAVGPGIGTNGETENAIASLLENTSDPIVVDADAINIIAHRRELIELLPAGSILTPHLVEFERLAGKASDGFNRLELLSTISKQYQLVVVLKGPNTAVANTKGEITFNTTGNPGMATAGSGDVLTGIITGLLAQGYSSQVAASLGVYIHGAAGDLASEDLSEESLIASDITERIGAIFKKLHK